MKLQYISDIHLERRTKFPRIKPKSSKLALLGDIGHPHKPLYRDFIKYTSHHWNKVFVIAGNHEYHSKTHNFNDINYQIRNICSQHNNVHFLNNESFKLNNYTILGTTLWSNIKYIRYPYDHKLLKLHVDSTLWLKDNLNKIPGNNKAIVLTHHLPSYKLIVGKYKDLEIYNKIGDRFASNLDNIICDPVKIWLCGHSHITYQTYINNVYVGINSMGHTDHWNDRYINIAEITFA